MKILKIYCEGERDQIAIEEVVRKFILQLKKGTRVQIIPLGGRKNLRQEFANNEQDARSLFVVDADQQQTLLQSLKGNSPLKNMIICVPTLMEDWFGISYASAQKLTPHEFWSFSFNALTGNGIEKRLKQSESLREFVARLHEMA